jgi:septal ring factor EnvC (AmiA/AmiB activator)
MSGSIKSRIRKAAQAVSGLSKGNTFDDWLAIGEGLLALREEALQAAGVATPHGPNYKRERARVYARETWTRDPRLKHPTDSNAIWMAINIVAIQAWRATLTPDERDSYNHPFSVQRAFKTAQQGATGVGSSRRRASGSSAAVQHLQQQIAALQQEIANLKTMLGSLPDDYMAAQAQLLEALQRIDDLSGQISGSPTLGYAKYPYLDLEPPFSKRQVAAAYRVLAKLFHPDRAQSLGVSAKLLERLMGQLNQERDAALKEATEAPDSATPDNKDIAA